MTQRGEPQIKDIMRDMTRTWQRVPDMSFARFFAQILACAGYSALEWNNVLFMGSMTDVRLAEAIDRYNELLNREQNDEYRG